MHVKTTQLALGMFLAMAATLANPDSAFAIIGGELDGNNHPNVGAVVFVNAPDYRPNIQVPRQHFTGTLIHPYVMLVTGYRTDEIEAHLADGTLSLDDMRVSFDFDAYNEKSWRKIAGVFTHPDYDVNQANGGGEVAMTDVGVVILAKAVRGIKPATLAPKYFLDWLESEGELQAHPNGTPFLCVGYGTTEPHGSSDRPGIRRAAFSEFHNLKNEWLRLSQNFSQDEGGTGYGDAGCPVFWVDPETGQEFVVGLASRGDWELVSTGLYYRTDIPETLDFIAAVIEIVEDVTW